MDYQSQPPNPGYNSRDTDTKFLRNKSLPQDPPVMATHIPDDHDQPRPSNIITWAMMDNIVSSLLQYGIEMDDPTLLDDPSTRKIVKNYNPSGLKTREKAVDKAKKKLGDQHAKIVEMIYGLRTYQNEIRIQAYNYEDYKKKLLYLQQL
jgi:hypothetical protein